MFECPVCTEASAVNETVFSWSLFHNWEKQISMSGHYKGYEEK